MMRVFIVFLLCLVLSGCSFLPPGVMSGLLPDDPAPAPVESKADHVSIQADQRATVINGIENHGTLHVHIDSAPNPPSKDEPEPAPGPQAQFNPDPDPDKKKDIYATTKARIMASEGFKPRIYPDQNNLPHIGYGTNLAYGITKKRAKKWLDDDFDTGVTDLRGNVFPGIWDGFPFAIRDVLADMRYQLGYDGFRGFGDMIQAVEKGDWLGMAREMRASVWHNDPIKGTPARAEALALRVDEYIKTIN